MWSTSSAGTSQSSGGSGGAGVVGVGGFDERGVVAGEPDAGLAGPVQGGDAVIGAATEVLHVPDEVGVRGGVLGDLGVESGRGSPVAGTS